MTIRVVDGAGAWQNVTDFRVVQPAGTWERVQKAMVVDDGGLWQPAFIFDNTGPSAPTSLRADWVWVNAASSYASVSWVQPTDPDFSYSRIYVNKSFSTPQGNLAALSYTELPGSPISGSGAKSITDVCSTYSYTVDGANTGSNIHYYKIVPYDTRNNAGTAAYVGSTGQGQSTVRGIRSSPYIVNSTLSRTWRVDEWRTDLPNDASGGDSRALQALYNSSSLGNNYGFYWYANRPSSLNITKADIYMKRETGNSSGASSSVAPRFRLSGVPSSAPSLNLNPLSYTSTGTHTGTGLTVGATAVMMLSQSGSTITLAQIQDLMANTTYRAVGLFTTDTLLYAIYSGVGDNGNPPWGSLSLTHTG